MTFTIDEPYKSGVPRGEFYRSGMQVFSSSTTANVVISPASSPESWALLCDKVRFLETSFTTSGTGSGILQVEYPDYSGLTTHTYTFESVDHLKMLADEVQEHNSATYYVWKPQPPILTKDSKTYSDITFSLPTNVDVSSGTLQFLLTGWTLKEDDFD